MHSPYRQSSILIARTAPALITLLVTLCAFVPVHMTQAGEFAPRLTLVCIFYWGVYSPHALPYIFLFLLGVLQDSLAGTPLGMSSFINLGLAYLLHSQRRLMGKAHFGAVWLSAIALLLIATLAEWSIMCLVVGKSYSLVSPLWRWLVTCAFYPVLHTVLTVVYKRIGRG